ncbi:hypothetical protein K491DRAFT_256314 [Lophiostoma macrostomum CBS 122681]|uniref:Uncharacterized protein n=1 Tax=Lophiostoma macrostomum CBS 122681 TaxID=1314788 RepID=A0A6A6SPT0_9PLEO|nr:hypothetical protein K491DRAFT_256314 [Lophiostoma macrostomum CBS 122681]
MSSTRTPLVDSIELLDISQDAGIHASGPSRSPGLCQYCRQLSLDFLLQQRDMPLYAENPFYISKKSEWDYSERSCQHRSSFADLRDSSHSCSWCLLQCIALLPSQKRAERNRWDDKLEKRQVRVLTANLYTPDFKYDYHESGASLINPTRAGKANIRTDSRHRNSLHRMTTCFRNAITLEVHVKRKS